MGGGQSQKAREGTGGGWMTKRPHKSTEIVAKETATPPIVDGRLLENIRGLIESAKSRFAQTANAALVTLYWNVENRIKTDILGNERAQYGRQIVSALSRQLTAEYGKGFSEKNLRRMIQFAKVFPDQPIVVSLTRQLSWTHFVAPIHKEGSIAARVLCRGVPCRAMEHPDTAGENTGDASRAHRNLKKACGTYQAGT